MLPKRVLPEPFAEDGEPIDYRFLEVNPAFERHTGLPAATSKRMRDMVPEHEAHWLEVYSKVAITGEPVRFVNEAKHLGGRWFNVNAFRVGEPERRQVAILFTDITSRKEVEDALHHLTQTLEQRVEEHTLELTRSYQELRRSEARFSQAFHTGPFAAALTTPNEDSFLEVNEAFLQLSGYSREEVLGKRAKALAMWASPQDQEKLSKAMKDSSGFQDLELSLRTKDGRTRSILMSAAVIPDGKREMMLKMFYDITERKTTEENLMRAIEEVMQDASWFSQALMEKLANIRSGEETSKLVDLTSRERQVLLRLAKGMNNEQIAESLGLRNQTVRNYIASIYSKLNVHSRAEAVVWARERGLV